ncbi:SCO7613 C-terminal domain-containing membrane protein [Streptomyces sp. NBC_01198]|uniref:SCO7613 C-terminal domain-containing membrane protein n=1 Tax=Streptomyces sp. NBC_01198 TaxID=2903769 RepID=UPI002E0D1573|nr:hypothetical protein OG702_21590 [Streptomyces sp. NBC_01198]
MDAYRCPDCNAITGPAVTDGGPAACPLCRLPLDGPEVAELRALDAELLVVETRRAVLHRRRAALVGALRARRRPVATAVAATAGHVPPADGPARSAQTVLLTLGGMLIVVAGLVFTLVSWGRLGIGGRAAVLTALTALVLAAPLALRRRGLDATAETASAVGLALVLLDAYAARAADLGGLLAANGAGYWAAVTGLGAVGAGAYGRLTRSVLAPYAALLLLQCAAPLTAAALHAHATGLAYALLAGAVLDLAVAVRMPVALGAAAGWTVAAGVVAAGAAYGSGGYGPALRACGPLLLAAALALAAARSRRLPGGGGAAAAFCGLALVAAAAVTPWLALPQRWAPLAAVAPAALLAAAALLRLRQVPAVGPLGRPQPPLWAGLFYAAALVLGLSALDVLPLFLRALRHLTSAGVVPVVAAVLALVLAGAAVRFGRAGSVPRCAAVLAAVAAVVTAPLAAGLPYAAALAAAGVPALGAGVHLLRRPTADPAPQLCALLASSAVALVWSLPHDTAALTVWDAAAVLAGCLAAGGRIPLPAAAFAVCALAYTAARAGAAAGLPLHQAAFAVLGVAVATVPVAARLPRRLSAAVERAGYAVGAVALLATAGHPDALSLALAVAGAACAGLALRPDRRTEGALGAAALLAGSSWVRLVLAGVGAPEPYTVSVSVVLLALGLLRRRRDPALGSWPAYGPGLAFSLLPSLVAAWSGTGWQRPLLLGLAALAVTLLGAHHRLRAPLALSAGVLLAVALHELAPAVAGSVSRLPHWAPVAAAGALLLYVGATYERRLLAAQRWRREFRALR